MAIDQGRRPSADSEWTVVEKAPLPLKPVTERRQVEEWPAAIARDGYARFEQPVPNRGLRQLPRSYNIERDRVRWGPIWAGVLTAMTSMLVLSLLGLAIGLGHVDTGSLARTGTAPVDAGRNSALWLTLCGAVSFLVGGYVAGRTSAVFARGWGALNGVLVFLLAVPVVVLIMGLGVAGNLGLLASALHNHLGSVQAYAQGDAARNIAWATLGALLLALAASAMGGYLGTRRPQLNRATGSIRE